METSYNKNAIFINLLLLWFSRAKVTPIHRHRGVVLGNNEFAAVGDPWGGRFMIQAGFSISFGLDELLDHHDNRKNGNRKKPVEVPVQEIREPHIDILEEAGFTLILAELPGITKKDIKLTLKDDLLSIAAARGGRRYYQEVLLPGPYSREQLEFSCNNGILAIRAFR